MTLPYPEPAELDRGDTPAIHGTLLDKVCKELRSLYSYTVAGEISDRVGVFAKIMHSTDGQRVIVIAKGSQVWQNTVSCQAMVPQRAVQEQAALLLAVLLPEQETPDYVLFNPAEIVAHNKGYNERCGVEFVNWEYSMGVTFYPRQMLGEAFAKLKKRVCQTVLG